MWRVCVRLKFIFLSRYDFYFRNENHVKEKCIVRFAKVDIAYRYLSHEAVSLNVFSRLRLSSFMTEFALNVEFFRNTTTALSEGYLYFNALGSLK